jgi:hypothetical protein
MRWQGKMYKAGKIERRSALHFGRKAVYGDGKGGWCRSLSAGGFTETETEIREGE